MTTENIINTEAKTETKTEKKPTFKDLGLPQSIQDTLESQGITNPTEIQEQAIPFILKETKDLMALAQTGTGKTAAYGLPLLNLLSEEPGPAKVLIITPTRELTLQVTESLQQFKGNKKLQIVPVYGGDSIMKQAKQLSRNPAIIVGTPGRIIDHLKNKRISFKEIDYFILDEADEMLNIGFEEDIKTIFEQTNPNKRTLLFSATMPNQVQTLAETYMSDYDRIQIKKKNPTTSLTEQHYIEVNDKDRLDALYRVIDQDPNFYGIVFCKTKRDVDQATEKLIQNGYPAEALHGDLSQEQRKKMLYAFKQRRVTILMATDVASRGIDVPDLTHVINFAPPQNAESYVHRVGRTGRAGKKGIAISIITPRDFYQLNRIQRALKIEIKKISLPKVEEIMVKKKSHIEANLTTLITQETDEEFKQLTEKLCETHSEKAIIAALLQEKFKEILNPKKYKRIDDLYNKSQSGGNDRYGNRSNNRGYQGRKPFNRSGNRSGNNNFKKRNNNNGPKKQYS